MYVCVCVCVCVCCDKDTVGTSGTLGLNKERGREGSKERDCDSQE